MNHRQEGDAEGGNQYADAAFVHTQSTCHRQFDAPDDRGAESAQKEADGGGYEQHRLGIGCRHYEATLQNPDFTPSVDLLVRLIHATCTTKSRFFRIDGIKEIPALINQVASYHG